MCASSMVGDHYRDMWQTQPWYPAVTSLPQTVVFNGPPISRAEFDELKRQVAEMKELLTRAKKYDEETGQRECEMDEKMDVLRKVAKLVGVDLSEIIPKNQTGIAP